MRIIVSFAFMRRLKDMVLALAKKNSTFFYFLLNLTRLVNAKIYHQRLWKNHFEKEFLESLPQPCVVLDGSYKGMVYPKLESYGSELAPKILGTYEFEIQEMLDYFLSLSPKNVLDIGCAEGYYAVGIGMRLRDAQILAFDISDKALSLCKNLALVNKVSNIDYRHKCDAAFLAQFAFQKNDLIICDTEGYEWLLFDEENVKNLRFCNLIIELHDTKDKDLERMIRLFDQTHHAKIVPYITRLGFEPNALLGIDPLKKQYLLSECRNGILYEGKQEWLVLQSKSSV